MGSPKFSLRSQVPIFLVTERVDLIRTSRPIRGRVRRHSSRPLAAACCRRSVGAGMATVTRETGAGAMAVGDTEVGPAPGGVDMETTRTPTASTAAFGIRTGRVGLTHRSRTGSTAAQGTSLRFPCRSTRFIRSPIPTVPLRMRAIGRRAWASIIGSPRRSIQPKKKESRAPRTLIVGPPSSEQGGSR
jgi:hypothetical protein